MKGLENESSVSSPIRSICQIGTNTWSRLRGSQKMDKGLLRPMFSLRRLLILAAGLASCVNAKSSTGNSVLVVVEPKRQDDFSIFFDGLKSEFDTVSYSYICWAEQWISVIDNGYELTFRSPKDQSPPIIEFDESSFAHAILFASETKSEYHRLCKLFEGALSQTHIKYLFSPDRLC